MLFLLALWVAWDFVNPLGWAVVVTVACWPTYTVFVKRFQPKHRTTWAPLIFTCILGIVVFIPLGLALSELSTASDVLLGRLAEYRQHGVPMPGWLGSLPFGDELARWWAINLSEPENARHLLGNNPDKQAQAAWTRGVGVEILHRSMMLLLSFFATFGLLRSGAPLGIRVLDAADRVFGGPGEQLARKLVDTIRGTVNGTLCVALAEGIIIGAAYVGVGVPRPLLFAILTAAFAMIPFGAWAVFTTAALVVANEGGYSAALFVFGFGAMVMIVGDTLVWPWLVGNQARLPFMIALIGIFGGLQTFGLIGLFAGPVILSAFWIVTRDWLLRAN